MDVGLASRLAFNRGGEDVLDGFAGRQDGGFQGEVRLNGGRATSLALFSDALVPNGRDKGNEFIGLLFVSEVAGEVFRGQAGFVRLGPDLEEVDLFLVVSVVFAVTNTS